MELIDKDKVIAEIERRIKERDFQMKSGCWVSSTYMYEDLLDFLDTLEVKEVDLEKEVDLLIKSSTWAMANREDFLRVAKHFYELGLKAHKGG